MVEAEKIDLMEALATRDINMQGLDGEVDISFINMMIAIIR